MGAQSHGEAWIGSCRHRRKGGMICTVGEHAQPTEKLAVDMQLTRSYMIRFVVGGVHVGDGSAWPRVVSSRESVLWYVIFRKTSSRPDNQPSHRISHDAHAHARSYILSQPDMNAPSLCATANRARHHR
jgi:hypothetical protein